MFKIPNEVKIGIYDYKVELTDEVLVLNGRECRAIIDYDNLTITINSEMSKPHQFQSLWHEILHGVIREHRINISDEEDIVDGIATALIQIMQDNPHLFYDQIVFANYGGESIE